MAGRMSPIEGIDVQRTTHTAASAGRTVPRIDKSEFRESFKVFGKSSYNNKQALAINKEDLPNFLKSIGLGEYKSAIEEEVRGRILDETTLDGAINAVLRRKIPNYDPSEREWPSDEDVLKAFSVFDKDGNGSIPVKQLKRFLLQAQLEIPEEDYDQSYHSEADEDVDKLIREVGKIDNDDQINYEDFVEKMMSELYTQNVELNA